MEKTTALPVRILICRSNPIAPDPRVEKEARCLSEAGYSVEVLGWDRSGILPIDERMNEVRIRRFSIRANYARGLMNFFPLLRWQIALLSWLFRFRRGYDQIHACDFDTIFPALICKKLFRKKVVYDIFDFYADHLRATPEWIKRLIRLVDLWAIEQADAVILVDDARLAQIAGAHPKRSVVIYNSPEDLQSHVIPHGLNRNSSLRFAYIGLLQVERGLLDVLELLRRHPEWALDIAGFGGDEALILEIAKDLPNVGWYGRVPYQISIELSAGADVLFALYDPRNPNHRYSSPNKLFEAMMLGKPIVVARGTNMDRIVEQTNVGLVVEYGDITDLEEAFLHLERETDLRLHLGRNSRRAYEQIYSWEVMKKRLLELYRTLVQDRAQY